MNFPGYQDGLRGSRLQPGEEIEQIVRYAVGHGTLHVALPDAQQMRLHDSQQVGLLKHIVNILLS